jgi:signal transduction histidine kinase
MAQYENRVHEARLDERRRIARELHDRLGEVLTVGLRQLDLDEIMGPEIPEGQAAIAREVLVEAMRRLRLVTSGLRDEPVTSFEKAVEDFLNRVCADADVHLVVLGDEAWAPSEVIDEAFLIVREALRNALTHGAPQSVVVGVEVTRRELRAWVDDDGQGFTVGVDAESPAAGTGLATMRERAALLGGTLAIVSKPGRGTSVELSVPLSGRRHK